MPPKGGRGGNGLSNHTRGDAVLRRCHPLCQLAQTSPPQGGEGRCGKTKAQTVSVRPLQPHPSHILHQPQRVVDGGVGVAGGDGVADAEELEGAAGVAADRLRLALDQRFV